MIRFLIRTLWPFAALTGIASAQEVVAKWQTRSSAASQDYASGVANSQKDQAALAIAAIPRMRQRVIDAIDSGKVANGLRRTGTAGYKDAVARKGVTNYQTGVSNAGPKVLDAFTRLLQFETGLQQQVQSMPNATDADRENRMLAWVRGMRSYTG